VEVTSAEVSSAFESWQVLRHSNLYAKLPTLALCVMIAYLLSLCIACVACVACALVCVNSLIF
jgi:formate hydrogenlyase subunit 6/NADH:ubiquinone oxidoreductase subunit I